MRSNWSIGVWGLLAAIVSPPSLAALQQGGATLSGRVLDAGGDPIERARVTVGEAGRFAFTDAEGRFQITDLARREYTVAVQRIGFHPTTRRVQLADNAVLDVVLEPSVVQLPAVQVSATPLATAYLDAPQPVSSVDATL
ncbi:hypothetical protein HRbin33_00151 [bacterium HR33]|nr:hypothetical protein HRbin33_00151 [bacterium HR33]